MSAFATVVGRLSDLSESELRQLHSIVGIRLGIASGESRPHRGGGPTSNKVGKGKRVKDSKSQGAGKTASSKGNPSRKSQWETHPLYREYKRLKSVVETQAKEGKSSFAAVDTPERAAYNLALSQWLSAKSSFRDRSGPQKEGAEETSAKGKEKAGEPAPPGQPGGSSSGNARGTSWADEVQDAMDVEGNASGSSEDEPEELPRQPAGNSGGAGPKRGVSTASLPSRATPPKKSSGVAPQGEW
jgi:hypothetical protein